MTYLHDHAEECPQAEHSQRNAHQVLVEERRHEEHDDG